VWNAVQETIRDLGKNYASHQGYYLGNDKLGVRMQSLASHFNYVIFHPSVL